MARYCSPQLSVRTRLSPPYRTTIRLKVFHGRNSISWAKSVLPAFIGDSRDDPGSLLRLQIVDTAFCSETRQTPGVQSRRPSVNRTPVVASGTFLQMDQAAPADQAVLRDLGERGEDPDMDRRVGLRAGGHHQEAARPGGIALHIDAGPFGDNI